MRTFVAFIISILVFASTPNVIADDPPKCIGPICFDKEYVTRIKLAELLKVKKISKLKGDLCLKTNSGNYLLILFVDHPSPGNEVESAILSSKPICKVVNKNGGAIIADPLLDQKIRIGDTLKEVNARIGKPKYFHKNREDLRRYQTSHYSRVMNPESVNMYVTPNPNELLAAWVYFRNDKVVGYEISVSE